MPAWTVYRHCPWLQPITQFVMRLPPGARVLDLGSSIGARVSRVLEVRPDLRITASDLGDFARHYPATVTFRQFDATGPFPFAAGEFDAVISTHLLEHLPPPRIGGVVDEIQRVVKPGGRVYLEAPGIRSVLFPSVRYGLAQAGLGAGPANFYDDITHVQPFTLGRLYKLLAGRRFAGVRVGVYRNKLFLLAAPGLLLGGLLLRRRLWIVTALYHLGGWAVYATATRGQDA